jgi:hypothetical protein
MRRERRRALPARRIAFSASARHDGVTRWKRQSLQGCAVARATGAILSLRSMVASWH